MPKIDWLEEARTQDLGGKNEQETKNSRHSNGTSNIQEGRGSGADGARMTALHAMDRVWENRSRLALEGRAEWRAAYFLRMAQERGNALGKSNATGKTVENMTNVGQEFSFFP
ncbi:hypothetical protein BO94DRAFT_180291 [Aspergillus sclerotioniger CBS 115572]|uniref:Uncharacterized protein n=1 Tax=Aspergillus sclerotioniger CBS 115572 TaxID=1450535 RepID=A0A317VY17_9EURO|nr:hypothetical protein BO94DRAFT_180291 [Aspergillus sclerotioniger CBS 115572]PWY78529.1 hypothetical protein BO94DRAFT_180291 [Aspergillus sclerotioniger CBS 115572]